MGRQLSWRTVASHHISFTLHGKQEKRKPWERRDKKEEAAAAGTRSKNLKRTRCVGFQEKPRRVFNDLIAVCLAVINCETIRQKITRKNISRKVVSGSYFPELRVTVTPVSRARASVHQCLIVWVCSAFKRAIPPNLELTEARFRSDTRCCLQAQWKLS